MSNLATTKRAHLGVIGGSGLYDMSGISNVERISVETPWGLPSDDIVLGTLEGTRVAFLPRHGRGHRFLPSEVPYLANLWALKKLGCDFVVSVSAVGSLQEEIAPGQLVVVDQFIDRTTQRRSSFFGGGVVGHVPFGDPVCPTLRPILHVAAKATGAVVRDRGTYVCIEGPAFSTRAESNLYRSWGAHVVGMTNLPEAKLAREAGMSYATLALATDYDCWKETEEGVSVDAVVAVLKKNVAYAQEAVRGVAKALGLPGAPGKSPFVELAKHAIMTAREAAPVEVKRKLAAIVGDVLG